VANEAGAEVEAVTRHATKYYCYPLTGSGPGAGQRVATSRRKAMRRGVRTPDDEITWLHGDHLGSTSLTTNESGDAVGRQLPVLPGVAG
jgi:hypothetical protein